MRKSYKLTALLLAVLMLMALFMGCSQKSAATTTTAAAETAAASGDTTAAASADTTATSGDTATAGPNGVTINFLCVNENYTQAMQDCISRWEKKTGNKVDVQLYPAEEFITVLSTQMMSGGTVDIFRSDGTKYAETAWPIDYFADLSDRPWVSRLNKNIVPLISFSDGTIRGVPYMNTEYLGFLYRKSIFEKAGITDLPKNWTEFLDDCEKIKTKTDAIPVNISCANGSEFCTTHLMHALFSNVYNVRGVDATKQLFKDIDANKVKFADIPEYKTSLDQICELRDKGYIPSDFISSTYDMAIERLGTGKVAMHPCGDFILEPLLSKYPDIENDLGWFPVPYQDTIGSVPVCTGSGLHVAANAPHMDAALDFVDYYASAENQDIYNQDTPGLNLFSDVPASNNVITANYPTYQDICFTEIDEAGVKVWPEMDARSDIQEMMLGEIDSKGMLDKMDQSAAITGKSLGLEGW